MAVGSQFATYINPLLEVLRNLGGSARAAEATAAVADSLDVPDRVLDERLQSGTSRFDNQVAWARFYLAKTGYIDSSKRGVWALTEKGRNAGRLTDADIRSIIQDVQSQSATARAARATTIPESVLEDLAPESDSADHRAELLSVLRELPPSEFERLCQRLLREAGFEQVVVTGRSGDGGIDGIGVLEVNPFVSFKVLFQCKRYQGQWARESLGTFGAP